MLRAVSLLILSLILLSCETPNMDEPHIIECTLQGETADCIDKENNTTITIPVSELLGHVTVSPLDYAEIRNHHDALHSELNKCRKKND